MPLASSQEDRRIMARVHLWEWEDLPWVPDFIRRFITDHLRFLAQVTGCSSR